MISPGSSSESSAPWPAALEDFAAWGGRIESAKRILVFLHGRNEVEPRTMWYPWEQRVIDTDTLFFYPYFGPWSWMTPKSAVYVDHLVDRLLARYAEAQPHQPQPELILAGGSLGGHAVLQYATHTRHTYARLMALAPLIDLEASFSSFPDLRRSLAVALHQDGVPPAQRLQEHSPLHCVGDMPRMPILLFHGIEDTQVPIAEHSDRYAPLLQASGIPLHYERLPIGHEGVPRDSEWDRMRHDFIVHGRLPSAETSPMKAENLAQPS